MTQQSDTGRVRVDVDSVLLEPGTHRSASDGVCLLELASVMARERFSDRPRCVCVVIAAFLRGWNDRSSHAERQRLRPYARRIVGSRSRRSVTRRRRDICLTWGGADLTGNWASRAIRRLGMRLRILALVGPRPALRLNEGAGELASRVVFSQYGSEAGLRLVDTLLVVGSEVDGIAVGDRHADPVQGGDAIVRALVESALRRPVALPDGPHRQSNGNGACPNGRNGHVEGRPRREDAEREPART
jgi:hypothetical protein